MNGSGLKYVNIGSCLPNRADRGFRGLSLLLHPILLFLLIIPFTISDDEVLSEVPSSPLSTAFDITVIDAGRWLVSLAGCKTLVRPIRKKITLARRSLQ